MNVLIISLTILATSGKATTSSSYFECNIQGRCEVSFDFPSRPALQGKFQGNVIDILPSATSNRCLQICKETDICLWYSFSLASQTCITLENCDNLDEADSEFISGQVHCNSGFSGWTHKKRPLIQAKHTIFFLSKTFGCDGFSLWILNYDWSAWPIWWVCQMRGPGEPSRSQWAILPILCAWCEILL